MCHCTLPSRLVGLEIKHCFRKDILIVSRGSQEEFIGKLDVFAEFGGRKFVNKITEMLLFAEKIAK